MPCSLASYVFSKKKPQLSISSASHDPSPDPLLPPKEIFAETILPDKGAENSFNNAGL